MAPRKKDRRKPVEIVTSAIDDSDIISQEEEGGCSGTCAKSGTSRDSDNASC